MVEIWGSPAAALTVVLLCISFSKSLGANFATSPPFIAEKYADIERPRGLYLDSKGDIIVVGSNVITALYGQNGEASQSILVSDSGLGLNHGVATYGNYLYASSATTVYRWPYTAGSRTEIRTEPEVVIANIPFGGYNTRSLIISNDGRLYISIGARSNVDRDHHRAEICYYNTSAIIPPGGTNFTDLPVYARGLRNTVGLAFDWHGSLWGVDNGVDGLYDPTLGEDIHSRNPADELNIFSTPNQFYGFPYCFTAAHLIGHPPGQYAHPKFNFNNNMSGWCGDSANNVPPVFNLPAHNAPLGMTFYDGKGCDTIKGAFPCSAKGDVFIAFHGSRNSDVPDGYFVGWLHWNNDTHAFTGEIIPVIYEPNAFGCTSCFRPVSVVFNEGHLFVSSDTSNEIFRVSYKTVDVTPDPQPNGTVKNLSLGLSSLIFNMTTLLFARMAF